ncbi:unnamed protein product, partial [Nesidiocoris tenuis]
METCSHECKLTTNYRLRGDLEGLMSVIAVRDNSSKHHTTPRRLLFIPCRTFFRESVLNVNVPLFQNPNTIAPTKMKKRA